MISVNKLLSLKAVIQSIALSGGFFMPIIYCDQMDFGFLCTNKELADIHVQH